MHGQLASSAPLQSRWEWQGDTTDLLMMCQAVELSPLGVQAVVAERNELRYQLRKAAAELSKVGYPRSHHLL